MRSARIAEWLLSLVAPSPVSGAIVGDLLEQFTTRQPLQFWSSIAGTMLRLLAVDVRRSPLALVAFAAVSWFGYMVTSVIVAVMGVIAGALVWVAGYLLANHTGFELVVDLLPAQVEWSWPPVFAAEPLVIGAVAPFYSGRFTAQWWRDRSVAAWGVSALIWPLMSLIAPFKGYVTTASLSLLPLILTFSLAGTLYQLRRNRCQTQ